MGSKSNGINIPGVILDELKGRDYSNDERFLVKKGKKRGAKQLSRKDRRKLQRAEKKNKGKKELNVEDVLKTKHKPKQQERNVQTKQNKSKKAKIDNELPFSSDDDLSSGDFDEFEEGDLDEEEWQQLRELEEDSEEDEDVDEESEDERESQHHVKERKNISKYQESEKRLDSDDDEESSVNDEQEKITEDKEESENSEDTDSQYSSDDDEDVEEFDSDLEGEEKEMTVEETMAKLKALKEKKNKAGNNEENIDNSRHSSSSDYSDGSEFEDSEENNDMTAEETMAKLKALKEGKNNSNTKNDVDISSSSEYSGDSEIDNDSEEMEMTAEETMQKLKALKQTKQNSKGKDNIQMEKDSDLNSDDEIISEEEYYDDDGDDDDGEPEMTAEETMRKLKELKELKSKNINKEKNTVRFDLPDSPSEGEEGEDNDYSSAFDEEELSAEGSDNEMTAEETMEALKKAKEAKRKDKSSSSIKKNKNKKEEEEEPVTPFPLTHSERVAIQKDEWDMNYYAKKLGLKGDKRKIRAKDDFDAVGGLLEGLDFFENYDNLSDSEEESSESEDESDEEEESEEDFEDETRAKKNNQNPFPSDDELSSGDFDEFDENDLNEEEWEQLRELEDSEDESESENDDLDSGKNKKKKSKQKENPYVAPVDSGAYVPPSMRQKLASTDSDNATIAEIRKKVKSQLNKLSESNLLVIINSLNELYDSYARQYVTETMTSEILQLISQNNKLLDGFVMNYSAVVYALWKLRGTEAGASFLQALVEEFLTQYEHQARQLNDSSDEPLVTNKKCSNIISLISYCYNFGLMSSRLIFDIIKELIASPNEFSTELLLRIVSISGPLIRGDDPSALKDILAELLANMKSVKASPRMQFLLDVMADLKNNRLKPSILAADHRSIKKVVSNSVKGNTVEEPLQVTLEDIKNVEEKGKWWLVGASWKGNMNSAFEEADFSNADASSKSRSGVEVELNDDLLDDIPDWSKLAREQRMNTEVRRAIFISIMSAQDYVEASTKIEKLGLKNKQALEIPKVILHCLLAEGGNNGYNPYYALVASKLCEINSSLTKSFQFLFWDILKKFEDKTNYDSDEEMEDEDDDLDENKSLRKIMSQGKFFGSLIADNVLKLDAFKHVPLMGGLTKNGYLFIEVLIFQLLLSIAKKSETKIKKKTGGKEVVYTKSLMSSLLVNGIKIENKSFILKGLKWFIEKKLKYTDYLVGKKGEKQYNKDFKRMGWAVETICELIVDELETVDI